ncbi:MAG TPA: biliverdin-producing heme oxygenase [Kofleriaceae bacterium]
MISRTLQLLDRATKPYHVDADAAWTGVLAHDLTETEYASQLARVYGFEGPVEAALAYTSGLPARIDLRRRMRAGLIAQDLITLGLQPTVIAELPALAIAPFASVADALGWMYVVERSTAMHHRLREHVLARLPRMHVATTYLSAYDTSIGSRWIELGEAIEVVGFDDHGQAQLVAAAGEAFRCSIAWSRRERAPRERTAV